MEGIFRRSGEMEFSEDLMHRVVNGTQLEECVAANEHDILCVCQAIKVGISGMAKKQLYLQEIHLIPYSLYPQIEAIQAMTEFGEISAHIIETLRHLRMNQFHTLKHIIEFFSDVEASSSLNKMNRMGVEWVGCRYQSANVHHSLCSAQ